MSAPAAKEKKSFVGSSTPTWAKDYLPVGVGAWVRRDNVRFFHWHAGYPKKETAPRSQGCTFCDETAVSQWDAFAEVLKFVWEHHTMLTGEECPHDFKE